jgi:hypothetical protein
VADNAAAPGRSFVLTAQVLSGNQPVSGLADETVTFLDGTRALGTARLDGSGHATLTTPVLDPGAHFLSASFGGDTSFSSSASAGQKTIVPPSVTPQAVDGPKVVGAKLMRGKRRAVMLVLTFDNALDPGRAGNLANFHLAGPLRANKKRGKTDPVVRLTGAAYDAIARTVTITPHATINARNTYRLTVVGTGAGGITDTLGNPLDGARTGKPGSDYVANLTQGVVSPA